MSKQNEELKKQLKDHISECEKEARNECYSPEARASFRIALSKAFIALANLE